MKSGSIPTLSTFLAVVVFGLVLSPTSHAQQRPADPLMLRFPTDAFALRGPGSQIGVSARELKPAETDRQNQLRASVRKQRLWGVILEEVHAKGPASQAGLMRGDIIIEFDGEPISGVSQFYRIVEETPPGWTVKVNVVRDGKLREISITPTYQGNLR